jgi:hypothetical protein
MAKKKNWLGMLVLVLAFGLIIGCASINPMSDETIARYGLEANLDLFKSYQYFVSRDIILTNVNTKTDIGIQGGQAYSSTSVDRDVKQILSSTPGVALEVAEDSDGRIRLGIAFEVNNDNLLWFVFDPLIDVRTEPNMNDRWFFLVYTNSWTNEINYAGKPYIVSYEQASGIGAGIKRLTTIQKIKSGETYENMLPILLYEENSKVKEKETRKTLQGRRL